MHGYLLHALRCGDAEAALQRSVFLPLQLPPPAAAVQQGPPLLASAAAVLDRSPVTVTAAGAAATDDDDDDDDANLPPTDLALPAATNELSSVKALHSQPPAKRQQEQPPSTLRQNQQQLLLLLDQPGPQLPQLLLPLQHEAQPALRLRRPMVVSRAAAPMSSSTTQSADIVGLRSCPTVWARCSHFVGEFSCGAAVSHFRLIVTSR